MVLQKVADIFGRAIIDSLDVSISRGPWIAQKSLGVELVSAGNIVAQPIQCLTQRTPPLLVPRSICAGITSAITIPALNAVCATPRGLFNNFYFIRRRVCR